MLNMKCSERIELLKSAKVVTPPIAQRLGRAIFTYGQQLLTNVEKMAKNQLFLGLKNADFWPFFQH